MQDAKNAETTKILRQEIEALQNYHQVLSGFIAGMPCDAIEVITTLQLFKAGLNRISAHILTLYQIKGQRTKITWEPLIENISNAIENLQSSPHPNPASAIQLAFNMSEPNAAEVMAYFARLKSTL